MKPTAIVSLLCTLAAAGSVIGVAVERHACAKLVQENKALHLELTPLDEVVAENQRLSNLVAQVNTESSQPTQGLEMLSTTDGQKQEILRLRGEVQVLRQQAKELQALREDTRFVRAALNRRPGGQNTGLPATTSNGMTASGSQLEILQAEYWTANARMDVAGELRERIRDDRLKAVASNNIKGDPEFGQVKHLTVVYRAGGVVRTNEFREGDLVILPRD